MTAPIWRTVTIQTKAGPVVLRVDVAGQGYRVAAVLVKYPELRLIAGDAEELGKRYAGAIIAALHEVGA